MAVLLNGGISAPVWKCSMGAHRDIGKKSINQTLKISIGVHLDNHVSQKGLYAEVP